MNRTSLRRIAAPSVAALALGLASPPAAPATRASSTPPAPQPAARPQRHPQRRRLERPGGRPGRLARRLPEGEHRRHRQLRPGRLRRRRREVHRRRRRLRRLRRRLDPTEGEVDGRQEALRRPDAIEVPDYVSPIAVVYNLDGVDKLNLVARRPSPASSPARSRRGTTRRSRPTTPAPSCPSTAITPVHRSDDSGTTKNFTDYLQQGRRGRLDRRRRRAWPIKGGEARRGHLRRDRGGQGRQGHHRVRRRQPGRRPRHGRRSRSATPTSRRPPRVPPRSLEASPAATRAAPPTTWRSTIDRTTTEAGAYPLMLVVLPDRLPDVRRRQGDGRPGQGLPDLRGQRATASRPRRRRRLGAARPSIAAQRRPRRIVDKISASDADQASRDASAAAAGARTPTGPGAPTASQHRLTEREHRVRHRAADREPSQRAAVTGSSPGSPAPPGSIILVALAGVAIFLTDRGRARPSRAGRTTYGGARQLRRPTSWPLVFGTAARRGRSRC